MLITRVIINIKNLDKLSPAQIAKTIYHELKAHLDMDKKRSNYNSVEDHKAYGETTASDKKVTKEAKKFHKQIEEAEKDENEY